MAVNVSTITSVCVYCKVNSNSAIEHEFHEIFDEVGVELQLPSLVETYFQIKVKNEGRQYLCDDCVNRLIELYDFQEHAKEKNLEAADLEGHKNVKSKKEEKISCLEQEKCEEKSVVVIDDLLQIEDENEHEHLTNSVPEIILEDEFLNGQASLKSTTLEISNQDENICQQDELKINENYNQQNKKSTVLTLEQVENEDIDDDFSMNNVIELCNLASNSTIEISNSSEAESQPEFLNDIENESSEIDDLFSTNRSEDIEVCTEISGTEDQIIDTENETADNDHEDVVNNELYEQLDETLMGNDKTYDQIDDDEEIELAEMIHYTDDNDAATKAEIAYISVTSNSAEAKNQDSVILAFNSKEPEVQFNTINSKDTESEFNIIEEYESEKIFEKSHEELSNDYFDLEEEYLIEEISCSEEYDEVDLSKYLDKVLATKFDDLELKWENECKLCLNIYNTFEELLNHSCISEMEEEQQFCCIIKKCDENTNNLATLARHLILNHYDQLESVAIYGKCPECQKTFSNIFDINKHSCCRNIKRKTGLPNYCQYCDMDFQSLKRYVFHMQFHLTNHRPKVCLLCGDLFKTSNEFFEHTQYQHVPETAMACVKCDRFFKDKEVFDQHISSHDTKYQYSCTLCPKKYTNKFILTQHMDIYHSNKPNTMKCKHCEKEFVNRVSYRNHMKCHDTDVEVEAFICSTCGIVTSSRENIKYHIEFDEDSPCFSSATEEKILSLVYTCENCSLDFHTIKHLKRHRLTTDHSDDLFVCGICRQSFKTLRHMRNHYTNHKDLTEWRSAFPITRYFVCNIGDCQEFYPIWTTLYYHKKRPHKTNKIISADEFKCQFCQQICSSKMSLAVHVARSHNNSNVKCSYCKRSFKSQKHLEDHIDKYHTPVECDICFKKFKHRRNLESHNNMVHLSIKRYFCKLCGKGYFHKSEKEIHEKKVHPAASFKCKLCKFVTTYPESLQVHMDKHNNQLKFMCTICGKGFGRKQLLKCHLKRHLNKKDFGCSDYLKKEGCSSTFLTYNLLKRHILAKHPNSTFSIVNLKSKDKWKKSLNTHTVTDDGGEDNSLELWMEDANTNETYNDDEDFEQDPIELVFETDDDDIQFNE